MAACSTTTASCPWNGPRSRPRWAAAALDWAEIDPSLLGPLFERGLDPAKRAQLGAHYTDRDKIMLIVGPVIVRPWEAEWETAKADIDAAMKRAAAAPSKATRTRQRGRAERRLRDFLAELRAFTVLDPACGSGNFLYLALHALKDLEHRVQVEAEARGFPRTFPVVGPANVKGIEVNAYAAELARVSVWIGEIQWMRRNDSSRSATAGSTRPNGWSGPTNPPPTIPSARYLVTRPRPSTSKPAR